MLTKKVLFALPRGWEGEVGGRPVQACERAGNMTDIIDRMQADIDFKMAVEAKG
jgi:hypothetical protein